MKYLWLLVMLLLLPSVQALEYYVATTGVDTSGCGAISTPCRTINYGKGRMSGGDTLIVRDGIYSGSSNRIEDPPSGTAHAYTTIKAEHDWGVTITGAPITITSRRFIEIRGFNLKSYTGTHVNIGDSEYIKVIRVGSDGISPTGGSASSFGARNSNYILFEECFVYGGGRYSYYVGGGDPHTDRHVIFRRNICRWDYSNTDQPQSCFNTYSMNDVAYQNNIVIDGRDIKGTQSDYDGMKAFFTANGAKRMIYEGNLALNVEGPGIFFEGAEIEDHTISNNIIWDMKEAGQNAEDGYDARIFLSASDAGGEGGVIMAGNTFGMSDSGYPISVGVQNDEMINTIIYGIQSSGNAVSGGIVHSYNAYGANTGGNIDGGTVSTEIVSATQITQSLQYLPRIETGSPLANAGQGGARIGADATKRIGVSGTLWGEPGWDSVTTAPLWPFPNEGFIKQEMASFHLNAGAAWSGSPVMDGARGFAGTCGDSFGNIGCLYGGARTLTSYIWEYLGHPCPDGICDGEPLPTCQALGGVICSSGWTCSNTPAIADDGACCLGSCQQINYDPWFFDFTLTESVDGALLEWTASEPTTYRLTIEGGLYSQDLSSYQSTRSVNIQGLSDDTLYNYEVQICDATARCYTRQGWFVTYRLFPSPFITSDKLDDTFVYTNSLTCQYGVRTRLRIDENYHALFKVDTQGLSGPYTSAHLFLFHFTEGDPASTSTIEVYPLLRDWDEGTGDGSNCGVGFGTGVTYGYIDWDEGTNPVPWPGGTIDAPNNYASNPTDVTHNVDGGYGWKEIDITNTLNGILAGVYQHGFLVKIADGSDSPQTYFWTSEGDIMELRPIIVLDAGNSVCGNDIIETGEDCEPSLPLTQTCTDVLGQGWSGTLACIPAGQANACHYDTTSCQLDSGDVQVWAVGDSEKITHESEYENTNYFWDGASKTITIYGARNEYTAFQVALRSAEDVSGIDMVVDGDLTGAGGTIPSSNIELFREYFQNVTVPGYGGDNFPLRRYYPDPLIPFEDYYDGTERVGAPFRIRADKTGAIWVDAYVPKTAQAGVYTTTLDVYAGGTVIDSLTLNLHVWDFTLSDTPALQAQTFMKISEFEKGEAITGGVYGTTGWDVLEEYYRLLHKSGMGIYFTAAQSSQRRPTCSFDAQGYLISCQWSNFDLTDGKRFDGTLYLEGRGAATPETYWFVPVDGDWAITDPADPCYIGSTCAENTIGEYLTSIVDHFSTQGWSVSHYISGYDESPRDIPEHGWTDFGHIKRYAQIVQDSVGDAVGYYDTAHYDRASLPELWDYIDVWLPAGENHNQNSIDQTGHEGWFYHAYEPYLGHQSVNVPGLGMRTWGAVAWKYDVEGTYMWNIAFWPYSGSGLNDTVQGLSVYDRPTDASNRWGNGVLVYPGHKLQEISLPPIKGPVPSYRLFALRRGVQDYDYASLLESLGGNPDAIINGVVGSALALEESPNSIGDWSHDPDDWYQMRNDLADAIIVAQSGTCTDQDGDTYLGTGIGCDTNAPSYDCNDDDEFVHPGASEVCSNGIDDDCDDAIDGADSECMIPYDLNGDGALTLADFLLVAGDYGSAGQNYSGGSSDVDGNGQVDIIDLVKVGRVL